MKRAISLTLVAAAAFVVFGRATCGKPGPGGVRPVQVMKIKDNVFYHNVGITYGAGKYYTINGGNEGWSVINVYDSKGKLLDSFEPEIDGRSIFYNPDDGWLYAKPFGEESYTVNPEDGEVEVDLEYMFVTDNSSVAHSPDGEYIYEIEDGTVYVYESLLGEEIDEFEISMYSEEHGYASSIAASDRHLFTWNEEQTVFVHTLEGTFITKFTLPRGGFGFSLSWTNGMLWIAEDADATGEDDEGNIIGLDGYWYGYRLDGLE